MLFFTLALGCASPGPPHAPSLHLPKTVNDLSAHREGDRVELKFTAPLRTTDNLLLQTTPMRATLCRQLGQSKSLPADKPTCVAVPAAARSVDPSKVGAPNVVTLTDTLPGDLTHGPARLLAYRVELCNAAGKSAGKSEAAYTAAGEAPPPVQDLRAEGTRLGILLTWHAADSKDPVVLERTESPKTEPRSTPKPERLEAHGADRTIDATIQPETPYQYRAARERSIPLGGRTIILRSAPAPTVPFTLHLIYPPPTPTALTAAGFTIAATANEPAGYAVDLIWQPVDDAGLLAGLAGYNIYREPLSAPRTKPVRLNAAPIQVPAFHDATAAAGTSYRYRVTAVDTKGNESGAATTTLDQP